MTGDGVLFELNPLLPPDWAPGVVKKAITRIRLQRRHLISMPFAVILARRLPQ